MHDYHDVLYRIQKEVGEWALEQFGDNTSKWTEQILGSLLPLLGMAEEIGELCHATGYRHSGRGFTSEEEYRAAIKDGLADLLVFACDYASRESIVLVDVLEEVWNKVKQRRQKHWLDDKAKEENRNREEEMKAATQGSSFPAYVEKEMFEQTGQGFAEPPEDGDDDLRDPETGDYKQCEFCSQYLDADGTCPEGCPEPEGEPMTAIINGRTVVGKPWKEPEPEDGWTVARKIVNTFVEGSQNVNYAWKMIDQAEEQWKKELPRSTPPKDLGEQQWLALTGKLAIAALELDPDNTSPKDVEDEIINLVAFKSDCNPASEE